MVYFGGLANVSVYRQTATSKVYKADHVVTASLLDSSMNELFTIKTPRMLTETPAFGLSLGTATERLTKTTWSEPSVPQVRTRPTPTTTLTLLASSWYHPAVIPGNAPGLALGAYAIVFNHPTFCSSTTQRTPTCPETGTVWTRSPLMTRRSPWLPT